MFGTLKPASCQVGCDRHGAYRRFYCGLCAALGERFGQLARGLLTYDAVFLALVADGLMDDPAAPDRRRCPMLPVVHQPTVRPDSAAMRYAAAMQILLADQWLADRAVEGARGPRAARAMLGGKLAAARAVLAELDVSLDDLESFEVEQARREVPGETGPREAAESTAAALGRVFARMACLPGVGEAARDADAVATLASFGRHLGSAIYLVDALDDLAADHRDGAFNPCLARGPRGALRVSWPRVEAAWALLRADLEALARLAAALPIGRHREIIEGIVVGELRRGARAAARRAHAYARTAEAERAREAWLARAFAAVAAAFVFVWVWLGALPGLARARPAAAPEGPPAPALDAGTPDIAPATWEPELAVAAFDPAPEPAEPEAAPEPSSPPDAGATTGAPARKPFTGCHPIDDCRYVLNDCLEMPKSFCQCFKSWCCCCDECPCRHMTHLV